MKSTPIAKHAMLLLLLRSRTFIAFLVFIQSGSFGVAFLEICRWVLFGSAIGMAAEKYDDWYEYLYKRKDGVFRRFVSHFFNGPQGVNTAFENIAHFSAVLKKELDAYVTYVVRELKTDGMDEKEQCKNVFWCEGALGADKFPTLTKIARVVLSITVSNGPLESAFLSLRLVDDGLSQRASTELLFAKFFFISINRLEI